jgi:hypothetical protein
MNSFEWFWVGVFSVVALEAIFIGGLICGQRIMAAGKPKDPAQKDS